MAAKIDDLLRIATGRSKGAVLKLIADLAKLVPSTRTRLFTTSLVVVWNWTKSGRSALLNKRMFPLVRMAFSVMAMSTLGLLSMPKPSSFLVGLSAVVMRNA